MAGPHDRPNRYGFPQTQWTLMREALHSEGARNQLLSLYHRPVRAFFMALARDAPEADELTQSFLVKELALLANARGGVVRGANPSTGRFRDYLAVALRNHWLGELRKKRRNRGFTPKDDDEWDRLELPRLPDAEQTFLKVWIQALVTDALQRAKEMSEQQGKQEHFSIFLAHFFPASGAEDSWEAIARRFGLATGKIARNRAQTVAGYVRIALLEQIAMRETETDLAQEVRDLLSILGEFHD